MATRHNLCLNPALTSNATGWGGGSTPARASVTGFGRPFAAEYTTSGSYASTAATATGAVTVGLTYTLSAYVRPATFNVNSGTLYVEWINGSGGGFGYPSSGFTLTANTVTQLSITATAPSGAVAVRLIIDGINFSINTSHVTMALLEEVATLGTYFDGDTSGATWDGTPGNSASTLIDSAAITAAGAAGTMRLRPGSGTLTTTQAASPPGTAGSVRVRASSGSVTAVSNALLAGAAGIMRLRPGSGTTAAAQAVSAAAAAGTIRLRAGAGEVTTAAGVTVAGAAGSIRLRAAQPLIITTQGQTFAGRAASIRARAGRGQVAARTPSAGDITIRLGATRRSWAAHTSRR